MPFTDDVLERAVELIGKIGRSALVPWGGAEACIDAYERAIRAATEAQLHAARTVDLPPVSAVLASSAHITRDIGAAHLSAARWILDA